MKLRVVHNVICKHANCGRLVQARGMCNSHYQFWRRHSGAFIERTTAEEAILAAMPGTRKQIQLQTGLRQETILKHLKIMRDAQPKRAYILKMNDPASGTSRWSPVYAAGDKEDHVVTEAARRERRNRQQNAINRAAAQERRALAEVLEKARPGLVFSDPFGLGRRSA